MTAVDAALVQLEAIEDRRATRTHAEAPVRKAGGIALGEERFGAGGGSTASAAGPARVSPSRVAALRRTTGVVEDPPGRTKAPEVVHEVLRSAGQPLPDAERASYESRLGTDLSRVRLHTGARAEESAGAVGARAYTVGNHVVFGPGAYSPGSAVGRQVLAHELAHVAQQADAGAQRTSEIEVGPADDPLEHQAHAFAGAPGGTRLPPSFVPARSVESPGAPGLQRIGGTTRALNAHEIDVLTGVYGTHLDLTKVQITENSLLAFGGIPRTTFNTINIPGTTISDDTLVHEAGHCYQNQRGDHYIASALTAQAVAVATHWDRARAYDYSREVAAHTPYDSWNSEQQAQWIEDHRQLPPSRRGVAGYP